MKSAERDIKDEDEVEEESQPRQRQVFAALVTSVDVEGFRRRLIRWLIQGQIPFTAVEQEQFRDLLLSLQPSLAGYLARSHNTMSKWIQDEYQEARGRLNRVLLSSKSRVHLSFDLWTSPSCSAILGVCAHFLDSQYRLRHALLALREMEGVHSGERIGAVVGDLIEESALQANLGVFVGDNAGNNDIAVKAIVHRFMPEEDDEGSSRRVRCLGHIINLAAKAFLLGNDCEAFVDEIEVAERATARDRANLTAEQVKWRLKGPVGKFHNIVVFIRASPQRRQEFAASIKAIIEQAQTEG